MGDKAATFTYHSLTSIDGKSRVESTNPTTPVGVSIHGNLTGLTADDHSQYYNQTRGDARYEQKFSKNGAFNKDFSGSGASTYVSRSDHTHSGYEPAFNKNDAFNKNFAGNGSATSPSRADHTHAYEPAFSKNSAFNKDFAGAGSASTVSRSDHTHNYEPAFSKNGAFNKDFGGDGGSTYVSRADHTHNYEPSFTKNSAFNKDFAGAGSASTVSRSDHAHDSRYLRKDIEDATTFALGVGSLKVGVSKWEIKLSGNDLVFSYNGNTVAKLSTVGYWSTEGNQESEVSL